MRKRFAFLLLFAIACGRESAPPATGTMDTREPVGIWYVGSPELKVHEKADDASPVIATYQNGEAVSVLVQKGEWSEVRTGSASGWVRSADLTTAEGKEQAEANPEPKFKVMPNPVSAPGAHGEIYIEADVNSDGEVISTRVLENTTGSESLAQQNSAALRSGRFYPIVQNGERRPFKYYHRVTY